MTFVTGSGAAAASSTFSSHRPRLLLRPSPLKDRIFLSTPTTTIPHILVLLTTKYLKCAAQGWTCVVV